MTGLLPDSVLTFFILSIIGIAILAGVMRYRRRRRVRLPYTRPEAGTKPPGPDRFGYQPEARPVPPVQERAENRPSPEISRAGEETSVTEGTDDIAGSLRAMVAKYSLDSFTFATSDGLLFASSGGDDPGEDAARYSEIFRNDPLWETPGAVVFGLSHKGSELIGIIRTGRPVTEETRKKIEKDAGRILQRWI